MCVCVCVYVLTLLLVATIENSHVLGLVLVLNYLVLWQIF